MKEHRFLLTLEKSHRLYSIALIESQEMPTTFAYYKFLTYVGFPELIHEVLTACVMYPTSIDSCRDALADLSHSFYQSVGRFRLTQCDQNRLTRLIDRIGNEAISILDDIGFYLTDTHAAMIHGGELTASVSIRKITLKTFEVVVHEDVEIGVHSILSQECFGTYDPSKWSH